MVVTEEGVSLSASILNSTKKALGLPPEYDVFDHDIIMHINGVFSTLHQLGMGPVHGFMIDDDQDEWDTFLGGDKRLGFVKTYMFLRVKLLFDPPTTSFHTEAIKEQIKELEWRVNVFREGEIWEPTPTPPVEV